MANLGGVGQGVTLSLSVDGAIARIRSVQLPEWMADPVDFSGLDNDPWMTFVNANIVDPGQFTAEIYLLTDVGIPTINTVQVATFTFPIQVSGNTSAATLTGSGFVTALGFPNAAVAEPLIQTITFKFDGNETTPAFDLEVA